MKFFFDIFNFLQNRIDKKFRIKSLLLAVAICFSSLAEMLSIAAFIPLLTKPFKIYEDVSNSSFNPFTILGKLEANQIIALFVIIFLLRVLFVSFVKFYSVVYVENIKATLQTFFFKKKITLPWSKFIYIDKPGMLRLISNDCSRIANLFLAMVSCLNQFVLIIVFGLSLIIIKPLVAIKIILLFSGIIFLYTLINKKKSHSYGLKEIAKLNLIFESIKSGIECAKEIKIYSRLGNLIKKFNYAVYEIKNIMKKRELLLIYPRIIFEIFLVFLIVIIFFYTKDKSFSLNSTLVYFSLIGLRLVPIFLNMSYLLQRINHLLPFCEDFAVQLNDLKETKKITNENQKKNLLDEKLNKIIFKNVNFSYNEDIVINNLNYVFEEGKIYGITGRSGSGKTTMLDLLNGLIPPTKGAIFYNNTPTLNIQNPYQLVSYIPQDSYIFEGTIKENITFFEDKTINEKLYKLALGFSGLDQLFENGKLNEDQYIKDNGVDISGGQKQRISIARAIYKDRSVLILDEATNALDTESEKNILHNLKELKTKKMIFLVSHNKNNYDICDRMVSLDD